MSLPPTNILDHIVHLTPPGSVQEVSQQFRQLGFNVIPGGTHAGGLTANALVILGDDAYLELIAFTHPASHYPPGSPDAEKRAANPWSHKDPGWIDFAFLGSSSASIASLINERGKQDGSGVTYSTEVAGGRVREDGKVLKWVISAPDEKHGRGALPFFCGDITARKWRVPVDPPSNAQHPSGVLGVAYVRVLVEHASFQSLAAQLTSVTGNSPVSATSTESVWELEAPGSTKASYKLVKPRLRLSTPLNEEEREALQNKGPGIYEVAFRVSEGRKTGEAKTPYGKLVWVS
ncbi:hypothetical protein SERLA73DRAFT_170768 [Serpula lacrymans var. lacrymans S7.3]|uniref:Glyoxalase-like domain-containing protein n=2 Tax=Serpula lacrymans var. lacrymans TaxID=341189 RepID=F8Q704_SERL3|nr:uncharacterized protein SERLADRAFT_451931 [Serpula lacrymans var. lacrymans S7.9]EGN96392.1 hypothetical protein SERLA73DRAFT_170768 [Serpula lacrymans var. lacrymans S7.3]EGO21933.1 hypothetical protein SERLADRAFT_451931 [Serpula lacrymans var. lacrymans S7.9]